MSILKFFFGATQKPSRKGVRLGVHTLEGRDMMDAGLMASLSQYRSPEAIVRTMDASEISALDLDTLQMTAPQQNSSNPSDGLDSEQIKNLRLYFKTNRDISNFISEPAKLLGKTELNSFFSKYGDGVAAIRAATEFADAEDFKSAKLIAQRLGDKLIKKLVPNFSKAFGVYGWVKTGMEMFKGFVTDPAQEQLAKDQYWKLREVFGRNDKDAALDSFASLNNIGHILTVGKERFRQLYNDKIFVEGTDQLLPPWQRKFEKHLAQWFEGQYQTQLIEETQKKLDELKAAADDELPGWNEYMMYELKNTLDIKVRVNPAKPKPGQSVNATIQIKGVKDFSLLDLKVTYSVVGSDGYTQDGNLAIDAAGLAMFTIPGGAKGVKDTVKVSIDGTTSKFEHTYNF